MQFPDKIISELYGINAVNISPFRSGVLINLPQQRLLMSKTEMRVKRLNYVHYVKEYINRNSSFGVDNYLCTKEGEPYCIVNGEIYTISRYPMGGECNFNVKNEISKASKSLAELHAASKGIMIPMELDNRNELGKLQQYFSKRLNEIKKLKKKAKKETGQFDYLFLQCCDIYSDLGEEVIHKLQGSDYERLCEKAAKEGIVCHHDYNHGNIILCDDDVTIINFEHSCPELKIYDLANLLRRKMRKCNWDFEEARFIISEYSSIESLSDEELKVMGFMLQFPQKFWRVVNKFYNSRRSWCEKNYVGQLQEVMDEMQPHSQFMEKYHSFYIK